MCKWEDIALSGKREGSQTSGWWGEDAGEKSHCIKIYHLLPNILVASSGREGERAKEWVGRRCRRERWGEIALDLTCRREEHHFVAQERETGGDIALHQPSRKDGEQSQDREALAGERGRGRGGEIGLHPTCHHTISFCLNCTAGRHWLRRHGCREEGYGVYGGAVKWGEQGEAKGERSNHGWNQADKL